LKQLIDLAEKYLKKVDREIEAVERSKKKETEVRERFDKANLLYQQGKLAEAQQEWRSVLSLTDNPEMKFYIGWLDKASGEIAKRKEEEEKLKRDERENLRLEAEKKCEEEIALRELERKLKEAKPQVKEEPKKETRIEAPQKNIEKTQSSSTQKREREINLELLRLQRSGN
jgi:hypothetical protein